ncbi:MAG: cation:proton antiporter [Candidatus Bathyarchaeota archaeon]|jgi:cell volume regulation protein A
MIEPFQVIVLFSVTIILSYFSGLIYSKIKVPDIVWLLVFGFLLGPILGLIEKEVYVEASQIMGVVALNIITFGAGIDTDIEALREVLTKSAALATMTFITIVLAMGAIVRLYPPFPLSVWEGMLLGTMIAGISTVSILSILDRLQVLMPEIDATRTILALESTIVDPMRIVVALTIIRMVKFANLDLITSVRSIYTTFILASVLGISFGLFWASLLHRLRGKRYNYVLTIAFIFLVYFLMESFTGQGGGTIATFAFGIALANHRAFTKRLGLSLRIDRESIVEFNQEISFFVKSYYFVYMGLIATISRQYIVLGIMLTAVVIAMRAMVGTLVGRVLNFSERELVISRLMFPLGTSALVMTQLPLIYDPGQTVFKHPEIYHNMLLPVLLGTVVFSSLVSPKIVEMQFREKDSSESRKDR